MINNLKASWPDKILMFFVSPVLAGKTHRDHFVYYCSCCMLLWKQVNIWLKLPHALMDFNQSWVIEWCNMGTIICWWGQRSHVKVKGHLRSSCKIHVGWKCESGLNWKVEVRLEPNLVYWYNMGTFICSCCQRSYTKVKGHLRSSCKIGWKCKNGLIWKVEVQFELNLVYWYNMETFICLCGQRSYTKIKGHLRSSC